LQETEITYTAALREAMREEMRRDERIIMMGEDIGLYGGAFKITIGLLQEFGSQRIRDTPISENAIVGAAVGAAIGGLIPVVEIQYTGFVTLAVDPIVTHAAFLRYMSGGQLKVPLVIRMPICQYRSFGAQHSLPSPIAWFCHVPGLKVVAPATPYDAKGLFKSAVRDSNPVIFFEHTELYRSWNKGTVPPGDYNVPIGKADVKRSGKDITIVSYSLGVHKALEAANELSKRGIEAEVLDLRTLAPLDKETLLDSVRKTKRAVIVDIDFRTGGLGAEVTSIINEEALYDLKAPTARVASLDVPVPFSPSLERSVYPASKDIIDAAFNIVQQSL
jgi:pyruvate/2-oxoglutarate/acetoin dehydrogenase E1 component